MAESNLTDPTEVRMLRCWLSYFTHNMKLARLQAAYLPGYNAAVGSSIRQGPIRGQQTSFQLLDQSNKSVLVVYVCLHKFTRFSETKLIPCLSGHR